MPTGLQLFKASFLGVAYAYTISLLPGDHCAPDLHKRREECLRGPFSCGTPVKNTTLGDISMTAAASMAIPLGEHWRLAHR